MTDGQWAQGATAASPSEDQEQADQQQLRKQRENDAIGEWVPRSGGRGVQRFIPDDAIAALKLKAVQQQIETALRSDVLIFQWRCAGPPHH